MRYVLMLTALLCSPALAQQQHLSPEIVALQSKLSQELQSSLLCSANLVAASRKVSDLEAELKQLKEKEPQKK